MKQILTLLFITAVLAGFSQTAGSISSKNTLPESGRKNTFIYQPPKGLLIPGKSFAFVLYNNKTFSAKYIPLYKKGKVYEFTLTTPDSTRAFVTGIVGNNKKMLDNNNEKAYLTYLFDAAGKKFPLANSNAAMLLSGFGGAYLNLKVPGEDILALYEKEYQIDPSYKEKTYPIYLSTLYRNKKDEAKPLILDYIQTLLASQDEQKWITALNFYNTLKMDAERQKTEDKIIATYPAGKLATFKFMATTRTLKDPDQLIAKMNEYYTRFNDTTTATKDAFYTYIMNTSSAKKDWPAFFKYADLVSDKNNLDNLYNSVAWKLSGEDLIKPGEELETAKKISGQSMQFVQNKIQQEDKYSAKMFFIGSFKDAMQTMYKTYADTYALILYKLGQYDSAFYYENIALNRLAQGSPDELERFAVYAEKVKGKKYAKRFLEKQIIIGKSTPGMKAQLVSIYKKLNISNEELKKITDKGVQKTKETLAAGIKEKMKNYEAAGFSLKNLQGESVSLAGFKNKVVVLDLWATWCGPCKASFPGMQIALNKYKDDKDVVFLFIDTWEHKEPAPMKEDAAKFIKDNNYTFSVLLDEKDKVVTDYKVDGIPTKFVIDKKGNVKYMSVGFSGKADELVEELSMMIEEAKN